MDCERIRPLVLKVNLLKVESLKKLSDKLTPLSRPSFIQKYGDILDLLFTNVPADAITTLAQFYDPPMRSFLFKDFQLAPTIEEFTRIMGIPPKEKGPFVEIRHPPKPEDLVVALDIKVPEFTSNMVSRRSIMVLPSSFLEKKADEFVVASNTKAFINILALLVYGLVLFPSFEGFIHPDAVSVFWAVLDKDKDLVPALLADVYYELHERHETKKSSMTCCLPLLYRWITSLLPGNSSQWNKFNGYGWSQFLVSIFGDSISWHSLKIDTKIIIRCGNFPNVPLIGSRACINYNPVLAM